MHGVDGLDGVEGLPSDEVDEVRARMPSADDSLRATEGLAAAIRATWKHGSGSKVTVVATGPMTNIALFSSTYPELIEGIGGFLV
jgi:uridine nucleosidase